MQAAVKYSGGSFLPDTATIEAAEQSNFARFSGGLEGLHSIQHAVASNCSDFHTSWLHFQSCNVMASADRRSAAQLVQVAQQLMNSGPARHAEMLALLERAAAKDEQGAVMACNNAAQFYYTGLPPVVQTPQLRRSYQLYLRVSLRADAWLDGYLTSKCSSYTMLLSC